MKRIAMVLAFLCSSACGGDSEKGLRAGTYRVQFDIPVSNVVPGGLIGHHDFTFEVVDPITTPASFLLRSSVHGTTAGYLSAATTGVLAGSSQWRIQWLLNGSQSVGVRVTMSDDGDGGFTLPFGCRGVRNELENFDGTDCSVVRIN